MTKINVLNKAAVEDEYDEVKVFPLDAPLLTMLTICPRFRTIILPSKSFVILIV